MKVCVLFSGGQDSTTCLLAAIKKHGSANVTALGFDYGQRHKVELLQSKRILEMYPEVQHKIFNIQGVLPRAALTDTSMSVTAQSEYDMLLPASFVPGRNILFFTLGCSYAAAMGLDAVISGVCQTDYSGYPDCREEFVLAMEKAVNLGLEKPVKIITPLMHLTKAETWRMAKQMGQVEGWDAFEIVRTMTVTDYNGNLTVNEWGYGKEDNPATILRAKGYEEAKNAGWI